MAVAIDSKNTLIAPPKKKVEKKEKPKKEE